MNEKENQVSQAEEQKKENDLFWKEVKYDEEKSQSER